MRITTLDDPLVRPQRNLINVKPVQATSNVGIGDPTVQMRGNRHDPFLLFTKYKRPAPRFALANLSFFPSPTTYYESSH